MTKVLLIVDVQNGFCPGGNLPVPEGDKTVPVINRMIERGGYDYIVASQDWHPANHGSFASQHPGKDVFEIGELSGQPQVMWPDHCIQGTPDAAFHPDLKMDKVNFVQKKGENPAVDSYSAFRDNDRAAVTGLADHLKKQGVTELHVCGLATEFCVKFSALDAAAMLAGVKVVFVEDASRGLSADAVTDAKKEMQQAGVQIAQSAALLPPLNNNAKPKTRKFAP
ncbi:MAG: bifunctional nicotinamidase/pyrazinamidase [Bdellovibrionales bacterium]|jgi:nicotinamidase/pyrazinamidase|nr:bifunctional nicotinamidase/pyrazinamidase [Bdellovibrionales bacterium]